MLLLVPWSVFYDGMSYGDHANTCIHDLSCTSEGTLSTSCGIKSLFGGTNILDQK